MRMRIAMVLGLLVLGMGKGRVYGQFINPLSATGSGSYTNSPSLIIDGNLAPRNTSWLDSGNVNWNGLSTSLTIDLGGLYRIQNLLIDADNNDDYLVQYSTDGLSFTNLFTFLATDGPVSVSAGGLDILTTDSSFPTNPGNQTTPAYVGRGFTPVEAISESLRHGG